MKNRAVEETHAFWRDIRKGHRAKQNYAGTAAKHQPCDSGTTPSKLAAHRAELEHDRLWGNSVALVREAAREFDQWMANEKAKRRAKKERYAKPPKARKTVAA